MKKELLGTLIIAVLCFGLGRQCATPPDVLTERTVTSVTDTTFVTHIDTVRFEMYDTIRVRIPVPEPVPDPVDIGVHRYTQSITDSLIRGTMSARVRGELLDWHLDYIPLFPRYIHRTDTVFVNRHTTVTERLTLKPRRVLGGGMFAGTGNEPLLYGPVLNVTAPSGRIWGYRYDLPTRSHLFSVSVPLFTL